MLKILQARLQHYANLELPDAQPGFRKGSRTRDQIANICWNTEKARQFQKNICFIDLTRLCGSQQSGKFFRRWAYQTNLTRLMRNLYALKKPAVRSRQGTINWFKMSEGVRQGWILSPCWFNLNAVHVMRNAGLDEFLKAGIKIAGININNLRYVDDTILMAESKEELKSFWWGWNRRVKKLA